MKPVASRALAAVCLAATPLATGTLDAQAKRAITHVAGDFRRLRNNLHLSLFLVTPEGVVATDPGQVSWRFEPERGRPAHGGRQPHGRSS